MTCHEFADNAPEPYTPDMDTHSAEQLHMAERLAVAQKIAELAKQESAIWRKIDRIERESERLSRDAITLTETIAELAHRLATEL